MVSEKTIKHNGRTTESEPAEKKEAEATEYERVLDNAQLVGMTLDVQRRIQTLLGQGVPLPMQQIENHHLTGLLECFVGPEESLRVREWHLMWVDRQLDAVEAQMRMQMLGILDRDAPS